MIDSSDFGSGAASRRFNTSENRPVAASRRIASSSATLARLSLSVCASKYRAHRVRCRRSSSGNASNSRHFARAAARCAGCTSRFRTVAIAARTRSITPPITGFSGAISIARSPSRNNLNSAGSAGSITTAASGSSTPFTGG